MNLKQALAYARDILEDSGIEDASLEGEILLRHVLGMNRSQLYTDLDLDLSPEDEKTLTLLLEGRRRGEPSAYITGQREFYGLDFKVNHNVLIPRPESELLVELAINLARNHAIVKIADIGTGCGAIAVSLGVNLPQVTIYATDISPMALEVALSNCRRHGVADRVVLLRGDLLEPLPGKVDLIIANLPYVREADVPRSGPLSFEPALAINGGKDGLDKIKSLCHQVGKKLQKKGCLLMEIGEGQAKDVVAVLRKGFPTATIEVHQDLADFERVVSLRLT